jgi:hypothetical protein
MKSTMMRMVSRFLVLSMFMLSFQSAQAGMIGTDQAVSGTAQIDRAMVIGALDRPEVVAQLQTMGLDASTAKQRVAAMTDEEVHTLAGNLDSLPAGAKTSGWAWAAVILIGVLIYMNFYQTKR